MARTFYSRPPGESFVDIAMLSDYVRGIVVDNPSGSWLRLSTTGEYIAPYTIGWARPLPQAATSVSLTAGDGPSGQLGTTEGDTVHVWLHNDEVASSPGVTDQFVNRSHQPETRSGSQSVSAMVAFNNTLIPNIFILPIADLTGKRVRLYSLGMRYDLLVPVGTPPQYAVQAAFQSDATLDPICALHINPNRPVDLFRPPIPIDLPVGDRARVFYGIYTLNVVPSMLIAQTVIIDCSFGVI